MIKYISILASALLLSSSPVLAEVVKAGKLSEASSDGLLLKRRANLEKLKELVLDFWDNRERTVTAKGLHLSGLEGEIFDRFLGDFIDLQKEHLYGSSSAERSEALDEWIGDNQDELVKFFSSLDLEKLKRSSVYDYNHNKWSTALEEAVLKFREDELKLDQVCKAASAELFEQQKLSDSSLARSLLELLGQRSAQRFLFGEHIDSFYIIKNIDRKAVEEVLERLETIESRVASEQLRLGSDLTDGLLMKLASEVYSLDRHSFEAFMRILVLKKLVTKTGSNLHKLHSHFLAQLSRQWAAHDGAVASAARGFNRLISSDTGEHSCAAESSQVDAEVEGWGVVAKEGFFGGSFGYDKWAENPTINASRFAKHFANSGARLAIAFMDQVCPGHLD